MGLGTKSGGSSFDLKTHLYFGFFIRFALIMYGDHHDKTHALKYTDIDYQVFTDAAREVTLGGSPFNRHTYRYTPFLAFLLIPNITNHFLFGKFLFALFDCLSSKLINDILVYEGHSKKVSTSAALAWLYNPLVVAISTRGSADSITAFLTLILTYFLKLRLPVLSGTALGIAIHFKLYPIIYTLPIYFSFSYKAETCSLLKRLSPNLAKIKFLFGAIMSFLSLTVISFILYDEQYIEESFLYHLNRTDTRHNFSIYFFLLYLCADNPIPMISLVTFIPQMLVVIGFGFKYCNYRDITFAMFTQTMSFVTFNKVVTSQYFIWYLVLLPLIVPRLNFSRMKSFVLLLLWLGAQGSWLLPAYLLEFHAFDLFLPIWLESIAFFCCNVGILMAFISGYTQTLVVYQTTKKVR